MICDPTVHGHLLPHDGERDRDGGEVAGEDTCRRGSTAARSVVDGGGHGQSCRSRGGAIRRQRACWLLRVPNGGSELLRRSCARKKERRGAGEYGDGSGDDAKQERGREREQQHGCGWMSTSDRRSVTGGRGVQKLQSSVQALLEVHWGVERVLEVKRGRMRVRCGRI